MGSCVSKRKESFTALKISIVPSRLNFDGARNQRRSPNYDQVIHLWNSYLDQADTATFNLFSSDLLSEPILIDVFDLANEPIDKNMQFSKHLHLVHFVLDYCLKMIMDREFNKCVMALSSLGAIHADMGVTASLMIMFAHSAITAIHQANVDRHVHATSMDYEMIRDVIIAVTQTMTTGIKNHNNKIAFVYDSARTGRCACKSRGSKLKYIDKRSHLCMRNMARMLADNG